MKDSNKRTGALIDPARLDQMRRVAGPGPVLILTHDNPDPDGLSSGSALARLFAEWGISSHLAYSGLIARAENIAMLKLLTPEWQYFDAPWGFQGYSAVALVDTQPKAGNNSLPMDILPDIVIDHHYPLRKGVEEAPFVDIQPEVGASVSLVYQYLEAAGVIPDPVLATAIFYGIQADTRGLSRGDSRIDQNIYFQLLSLIDRDLLVQVEQAGLSHDYFRAFSKGLQAAILYDRTVVAYLGAMHRPDFVAEMADLLIRFQDADAVLCMGSHNQTLHLSLRTMPTIQDAGWLIQKVVLPPGKAGGHGTLAGGQIALHGQDIEQLITQLSQRILFELGDTAGGQPLLG